MRRPPRNPSEPLLTRSFAILIGWQGILIAGVTLGAFYIGRGWDGGGADGSRRATTIAFMTLALAAGLNPGAVEKLVTSPDWGCGLFARFSAQEAWE